jgi:hypothetical protein
MKLTNIKIAQKKKMIKEFKNFNPVTTKVMNFGEYRKGSTKYGGMVDSIMSWLRMHKEEKSDTIKVNLDKFLKETNIDINELEDFLQNNQTKLISFDISVSNEIITFSNLNNTKTNRFVWEKSEK